MSATLERLEKEALHLTKQEREELREFLAQVAEDELEMTEEFKASIQKAENELAAGLGRVRKP